MFDDAFTLGFVPLFSAVLLVRLEISVVKITTVVVKYYNKVVKEEKLEKNRA